MKRNEDARLVKKARTYALSQAANPPAQRHIDIAGKLFDGIVRFDDTFYDSLARMVTSSQHESLRGKSSESTG